MRAKLVSQVINEAAKSKPEVDVENEVKPPRTSGEKAAEARGFAIMTVPQMAALYLVAKYRIGKREDKSATFAGQMAQKMSREVENEDFRALPYARLADVLDMNPLTVSRTTNKFMHLLQGIESYSEALYAKIIEAFDIFKLMNEAEVWGLAEEVINMGAGDTRSTTFNDKNNEAGKKYRDQKALEDKKNTHKIQNTISGLLGRYGSDVPKAIRMAMTKLTSELDISIEEIKTLARIAFSKQPYVLKHLK